MKYLLYALLFVFLFQIVNTCNNFLVQQCTDISIGFNSISTIKCIQLFPVQFNVSYEYSVKNYIIQKTASCYNILLYNSSSIILFSNQCRDVCPEQYCLLFDNQSNTSIINIFYSPSSTYELINPLINNSLSYDYFYFDVCSSMDQKDRILTIIASILFAIVVIITMGIILQCIIRRKLRKGPRPYRPYDIYWIIDCLLCQIKREDEQRNQPKEDSNDSIEDDNNNNNRARINTPYSENIWTNSTQLNMTSHGSSNTTHSQQINGNYSSGNSSGQGFLNFSLENHTPITSHQIHTEYIDAENEDSSDEIENHQSKVTPLMKKVSYEITNALSDRSNKLIYVELEPKLSVINIRL